MGTLWVEKQHGRDAALGTLEADRAALALAEPASPGQSAGQPLAAAISPVYYRTKAAYVLWMLRDLAGDDALSAALRAYDPGASAASATARGAAPSRNCSKQAGSRPDLSWFFADWVDADKGLPDLTIDGVFPTAASAGNWLVAVNIANAGYAAAEVPVTVRSGRRHSVTQRVRSPPAARPSSASSSRASPRGPGQRRHRSRNPGQRPRHQSRRTRGKPVRLQPIQPAAAVVGSFAIPVEGCSVERFIPSSR